MKVSRRTVDGKPVILIMDVARDEPIMLTDNWHWSGENEHLTITPSVRSAYVNNEVSHYFVRDGRIEYLPDCTHAMAGQTVAMTDLPDWLTKEE